MRRAVTYFVVLALLFVGGYFTQQALAEGTLPFLRLKNPLPPLPVFTILGAQVPGAVLFALIAGFVVFNVVGMGVTLAILSGRLSRQLNTEARGIKPSEPAVSKEEVVPPGKPMSDRGANAIVAVAVLLGLAWGLARLASPLPPIPPTVSFPGGIGVPGWILFAATVAILVGATAIVGIGLARVFERLNRELAVAAAAPPKPFDFTRPFQRVLRLAKIRMTFVEKLLTCLVVGLIVVFLGIVLAFVVPSYQGVAQVDVTSLPTGQAPTVAVEPPPGQGGDPQSAVAALPPGDAASGQALTESQGCTACHIASAVGPAWLASGDQPGIGGRAASRRPEYSAEAYLYESITAPNSHVVEGFAPDVMPKDYRQKLSDQQLADIIAYLLTLK